jgi:hypothetical protein
LWALTASGEILEFCWPVLSRPWMHFEVLIHCSGRRER